VLTAEGGFGARGRDDRRPARRQRDEGARAAPGAAPASIWRAGGGPAAAAAVRRFSSRSSRHWWRHDPQSDALRFPVLSLKVMGFATHHDSRPRAGEAGPSPPA